ncbi:hypothetical protein B0J13DRAFT_115532 [Dactylonectria estremocensis]|uniref:Cylicin I n=1 Tax=Dactylonectria estremocensis TaxID=1079267 RepID=A0A9P9FE93_9HYPO|nr:hypothetical protein B0J13DRAFT_115532 [Dactylonectria estremocensis]
MTTFSPDSPALWLFTSLTAGSSHIVTATSRLETILRANRVPFKAVDLATDEHARRLWGRRAGKDEGGRMRKLPGLVQEGFVLGDIVEVEDWNEYGELKMHVKIFYDDFTIPSIKDKLPDPPMKFKPALPAKPVPAAVTAAAVGGAAAAAAAAPKPPPAPPLPSGKATPIPATTEKPKTAEPKKEPEQKKLPVRSVADEAAQKAKELRLKSLREKVHGKDGAKAKEATKENKSKDSPKTPKKSTSGANNVEGLQSPTSGSWGAAADEDVAQGVIQSPTSATWKQGTTFSSLHGATVATVTEEKIKEVEKECAIKEEPEDSEEDSDDEGDEEEEKKDATKPAAAAKAVDKKAQSKEVDSDEDSEDSDDDDDDSDHEEGEDTKKPTEGTAAIDDKAKAKEEGSDEDKDEDDEEEEEEGGGANKPAEAAPAVDEKPKSKEDRQVEGNG